MEREMRSRDLPAGKLDPAEIETIRSNFPLYNQRRFDVYADVADSVVVDENGNGTKKQ